MRHENHLNFLPVRERDNNFRVCNCIDSGAEFYKMYTFRSAFIVMFEKCVFIASY